MKKFLQSNIFLIAILVLLFSYIISFISFDVVLNDKVYQTYLDTQYETKYDEYKGLDLDLSEFEEELKQFEQPEQKNSYNLESFYIDSLFILIPLCLVTLGFSATFLVVILFHKSLNVLKYLDILKTSLIAYLLFYVTEIISSMYFLIFKRDYILEDISAFEKYFSLRILFNKDSTPSWLWDIITEMEFIYFAYPLSVGLLLGLIYKQLKTWSLIGYSYLAYLLVLVFYNTVFWYLFDLF